MKRVGLFAVCGILAACSTTTEDLQRSTSAKHAERTYTENYQEIFRRITNEAKRCQSGNINGIASYQVDSQLYNELGFGEISMSLIDAGVRNYYWTAKVEKTNNGTKLSIVSGNTIRNDVALNKVIDWADGKAGCT